jgi:hypothetical protein
VHLPAISSWYSADKSSSEVADDDSDSSDGEYGDGDDYGSDIEEDDTNDAAELQEIMDRMEGNEFSFTRAQDEKLTQLACAAIAITSDEMAKM